MTHQLRLVAVSGGLQRPSRSVPLAEHFLKFISDELPCEQRLIEIGQVTPQFASAFWRNQLVDLIEQELAALEQADVVVVTTPVFSGSCTGLFKHFFDFIYQDPLIDKAVLLAAGGGSERHSLVIDH